MIAYPLILDCRWWASRLTEEPPGKERGCESKQQQYNKCFCGFSPGFGSLRSKDKEDSAEPGDSEMVTLLNKEWSTECSLIVGPEEWLHDCLVNTLWLMPWGLTSYPIELGPCS